MDFIERHLATSILLPLKGQPRKRVCCRWNFVDVCIHLLMTYRFSVASGRRLLVERLSVRYRNSAADRRLDVAKRPTVCSLSRPLSFPPVYNSESVYYNRLLTAAMLSHAN